MRRLMTASLTAFLAASLAGCSGGNDFSDLQAFMDEVDARPKPPIAPLPPFEQVPPFAYNASNKRSPFEPPVLVKPMGPQAGPQVEPDRNRTKQFLEQFPVGTLAMVGTLEQNGRRYGLIKDAEGGVHRVQAGDYMGTDHGKIRVVEEGAIELVEIVPDGTGQGWVQRARTVNLASVD